MIDESVSFVISAGFICWLTGYGVGKTWSFLSDVFKRATGTY